MWPITYHFIATTVQSKQIFEEYKNLQVFGIISDSRKLTQFFDLKNATGQIPFLFVAIEGEHYDGHTYLTECFDKGIAFALVNQNSLHVKNLKKEYQKRCLCVEDVTIALRTLATSFRQMFHFPVIAIGGSNGKTTTKEILSSFLSFSGRKITKTQKSENGFLGIAFTILQQAHTAQNPPHALVLEIGIDALGAMEQHVQVARPDVVILTALGPEHLLGLKTWENAIREELVLFQAPECKRVWQLSDPKLYEYLIQNIKNPKFLHSLKNDMFVLQRSQKEAKALEFIQNQNLNIIFWEQKSFIFESSNISLQDSHKILFEGQVPLIGKHNVQNFALAFGVALLLGVSPENILKGFQFYTPPPQRLKVIQLPFDTLLFDDTYNANPASMDAAFDLFLQPDFQTKSKILVLGDMLELENESKFWHENLFQRLNTLKNSHLCLFGPAMYNCYKLLKEARLDLNQPFKEEEGLLEWYDASHEPTIFFEKIFPYLKGSIILVKGSRGLRLERFVHCVENFFS